MDDPVGERAFLRRLFLPSLVMSYFATGPLGVLIGLLLIEIASTFEAPVGIMGQISTSSYAVSFVFALFMGVLSIRFRHKVLLIIGLGCIGISALGCFVAPTFSLMLVSYSVSGVGLAMVFPMVTTLVGEHLPLQKRGNAVGWIIAAGSLAYVIGAPLIGFIAGVGGWRLAALGFVLPVSLVSIFLAFVVLPSEARLRQSASSEPTYLGSFRGVFMNISAAACLLGNVFRTVSLVGIVLYGVSFFRERFYVPRDFASAIAMGGALCFTVGSLAAGRLVNKLGRRSLAVSTVFVAGAFIVLYVHLPILWVSLVLNFLAALFSGMASSSANSLSLEQVPKSQGTMMSMNAAALSLGNAFGSALGGLALVLFSYEAMGTVLGAMGMVAALVFFFLATDRSSVECLETG